MGGLEKYFHRMLQNKLRSYTKMNGRVDAYIRMGVNLSTFYDFTFVAHHVRQYRQRYILITV